jgi:hypothetical protein
VADVHSLCYPIPYALALALGASNLTIGLLVALPPLSQLLQLPAVAVVDHVMLRKALAVYASTLGRLGILVAAPLVLLVSPDARLPLLALALTVHYALGGLDFLFFAAFLLGLYAMHRLALVREEGEASRRIVPLDLYAEVRRTVTEISALPGLRQLTTFPYGLLRFVRERRRRPRERAQAPAPAANPGMPLSP